MNRYYSEPAVIKGSARGWDRITLDDHFLLKREVFLTDEVNPQTMGSLIKSLRYLDSESDEEITIYINSPGGDVLSGLAVYDYINSSMRSPVRTVVIGTAFSMSAILLLAGSRREALENGRIMIHDPSYSTHDIGGKKAHEIQEEVDKLVETRDVLARIISEVTGKPLEEVLKITSKDSFFDAQQALEFGLITGIVRKEKP